MNCKFSNKIRIKRQCEAVWEHLTDIQRLPDWAPDVEESRQKDEGETGRGSTLSISVRRRSLGIIVNYWEPPKLLSVGFDSSRYQVEVQLELVSLYNFTEVILKTRLKLHGFWILLSPFVLLRNRRLAGKWLESARRHLEDSQQVMQSVTER